MRCVFTGINIKLSPTSPTGITGDLYFNAFHSKFELRGIPCKEEGEPSTFQILSPEAIDATFLAPHGAISYGAHYAYIMDPLLEFTPKTIEKLLIYERITPEALERYLVRIGEQA